MYSRVSNTMRYTPGSRSRPSSRMRPSASVVAVPTTFASRCVSRRTRTPAAGAPFVVSSTCVETEAFAIGGVSYARDADASHQGGEVHLQSAARGRARAEDLRRDPQTAPDQEQARARALERRVHLGADGRGPARRRLREPHELSGTGTGSRVPGRH